MRGRSMAFLALGLVARVTQAHAQVDSLRIVIPSTLTVPNYHRVGIGQREMLEGGAFVARTDDGGACWYNPAGLVQADKSVLNASANAYDWTTFKLEDRNQSTTGSSFNTTASLVAGVLGSPIIGSRTWRVGFASVRPVAWQPGTADFAFEHRAATGTERVSSVTSAEFSQLVPSAGVGFAPHPGLRLGAALAVWWTSVNQSLVLHDVIVETSRVSALTRSYAVRGSVAHGTLSGGVQWDPAPNWTLGAMVRSPGLRLWGSSMVRYDAQLALGPDQGALAFRDEEARIDYRVPTHVSVGLSRAFARGAVEVDVRYDASTPEYTMISSGGTGTVVIDPSTGAPVSFTVPFADIRHQAATVVGFAAGGHYDLSPTWIVHLGVFSDPSPVEKQTGSYFRQIDILGVTSGLELRGDKLSGAVGFGYGSGDSGPVGTNGLLGGQVVAPSLTIRTISLTYAVSYRF